MNLDDLIARVEAADASEQRALLVEAWNLIAGTDWVKPPPAFIAMLDAEAYESAALMLVPEGAVWRAECHPVYGISALCEDEQSYAATPALALVAAALRARKEV